MNKGSESADSPFNTDIPGNNVVNLPAPSTFWRAVSHQTLLGVATLCRGFLYGLNTTEVHGLADFLDLLKSRADPRERQRGLLTVSNHVSVMDDPLIWGVLPFSFQAYHGYLNNRFSFGSHDICFKGGILSHFFTMGQVLPTHRLAHSPHGGPTQPAMGEAIRLFHRIPTGVLTTTSWAFDDHAVPDRTPSWPRDPVDPFTDPSQLGPGLGPYFSSQPADTRIYHAPSRYACNQYAWIHIFPEGMIHQSPNYNMRYFKWGVARLILEPPTCPDVVPMWIEGTDQIMHESRTFPRFLPRAGKRVSVTFGSKLDGDATFGDLRRRYQAIKERHLHRFCFSDDARLKAVERYDEKALGYPFWEALPDGDAEVRELWAETARRVREEVLKLRRARGWPDEDPKASAAETWRREGPKRTGRMADGSWVGDP